MSLPCVRSPQVSKDGKKLFFVSDMPNGYGKTDIYVVDIDNNSCSKPRNLGPNINTSQAELFPFIDTNNTLYFSSNGHGGLGNLDIFKSNFKNEVYQKIEKIPYPINSEFDDFALVTNYTTNSGYFTSNRKQGKGDVDIYAFNKKIIKCSIAVNGLIFNHKTGKPIDNTLISLFQNNILQTSINSKSSNNFNFDLDCDKNYKIITQKKGFETTEIIINTNERYTTNISKTIQLIPTECKQYLSGIIFNKENSSPIKNTLLLLFQNNVLQKTLNNNSGNTFNLNFECNKNYKIIVQKEGFRNAEFELKTDTFNGNKISKTILLTPLKCEQLLTGNILEKGTNKPLSKAQILIYKNNAIVATLTTNSFSKFNYKLECNANYRIVTQLKNYKKRITEFYSSTTPNGILDKTFVLEPNNKFIFVGKKKMIKTNPIYFDLDLSNITKDIAIELEKVVATLKQYPNLKIEINSHSSERSSVTL